MISGLNTSSRHRSNALFGNVDKVALLTYIAIVLLGLLFIVSASYDPNAESLFSFSHNYMKQTIWIGISWVLATVVLLLDRRLFHMFAVPAYALGVVLLIAALLFGREVNGAKAWFEFGPIRLQTMEFAKIAIALATARLMSEYAFSISSILFFRKALLNIFSPKTGTTTKKSNNINIIVKITIELILFLILSLLSNPGL